MESTKKFKAIVIGATGATGRDITDILLKSPYWSTVTVLVRRKIERWDKLEKEQLEKLNIVICEDLDILDKERDELKKLFSDHVYDSVFCCLGSRTKMGEKEFVKVDYTYVLLSALLCEKLQIPHFSLISSMGADAKSWFLYMKTKGKAEEDVLKTSVPYVSIFRPGGIIDRDNDNRFVEKIMKYVPFIPKINTESLAQGIVNEATFLHLDKDKPEGGKKTIYTHNEILTLSKNTKI